ncbi:unnamed protein product [Rhizophagus irregularis]|uniref:Uncharacterized protein n=1 Tax=Rhizophagus irregularis TaxID=588596 RepID=A0A915ZW97_9GLOM|nr:unnamed protein product [Rhizophagus irregularis]CAB5392331.1 unnamed protein product [Rhizophagus irregularis]
MVTRSYLQLIVRSVNVARVVASVVISVLSILVYYQKFNDYGIMIVIILCTYIVIITSHRSIKFTISNKL